MPACRIAGRIGVAEVAETGRLDIGDELGEMEGLVVLDEVLEVQVVVAQTSQEFGLVTDERREGTRLGDVLGPQGEQRPSGTRHLIGRTLRDEAPQCIPDHASGMPSGQGVEAHEGHTLRGEQLARRSEDALTHIRRNP